MGRHLVGREGLQIVHNLPVEAHNIPDQLIRPIPSRHLEVVHARLDIVGQLLQPEPRVAFQAELAVDVSVIGRRLPPDLADPQAIPAPVGAAVK